MPELSSMNGPEYFAKNKQTERFKPGLNSEYFPNLKITKEGELTHYSFESPSLDFSYTTKPVSFDNEDARVEGAIGYLLFEYKNGGNVGTLKEGLKIEDLFTYENFKLNNKASPSLNPYFDKLNGEYIMFGCSKTIPKTNIAFVSHNQKFGWLSESPATVRGINDFVHEVGHIAHWDKLSEESQKLNEQSRHDFEKLYKEMDVFFQNEDARDEILSKYNWDELIDDHEKNKEQLQKIKHEAVVNRANKSFTLSEEDRKKVVSIILESERSAAAFVMKFFKNTAKDLGITIEDVIKHQKDNLYHYSVLGQYSLPEEYDEWGGRSLEI